MAGNSPQERYQSYRENNGGLKFFKFPPESAPAPQYNIVLVAREYALGSSGAITNMASTAKFGYILPLPQMRLIDRYQVSYDDNSSYLGMLLGERAGDAIGRVAQAAGFNLNKFKSVLLQAPTFKRHDFVWKLSPKNFAESNLINQIANTLKFSMAPPVVGAVANLAFKFPYIFDIYFDGNYRYMYGFKPSVIESLDVDYSGGNQQPSLYYNGAPESVVISMSLLEIEVWDQTDYGRWYDNNQFTTNPVDTIRPLARDTLPGPRTAQETRDAFGLPSTVPTTDARR